MLQPCELVSGMTLLALSTTIVLAYETVACTGKTSSDTGVSQQGAELAQVEEHLSAQREGALTCLVCLETITHDAPVWSCQQGCYSTFHLLCSQVPPAWWRASTLLTNDELA